MPDLVVRGQRIDPIKHERAKEMRSAMTKAEKILWRYLRNNRLMGLHFRRQQVIAGFMADFYCHARALVVELDGSIHQRQADYDVERDQIFTGLGLRVLRITNDEVEKQLPMVLERIKECCTPPNPRP